MKNMFGKITGGVLLLGATAAVCFWPSGRETVRFEDVVRPVRSQVVKVCGSHPEQSFAGIVKAGSDQTMSFKVAGRLQGRPHKNGEQVKKGTRLAWLDPVDFSNAFIRAEAVLHRDRLAYERRAAAAQKNAISRDELTQAESALRQSEAAYTIARCNLLETELFAPYDCVVANGIADPGDMVSAGQPILKVQDMSDVKVDVFFPESLVIHAKKMKYRSDDDAKVFGISFDSASERRYPAHFVEFKSVADKMSQTFAATYRLSAPDDLQLLPGMSATLYIYGDQYYYEDDKGDGVAVPESALGVDSTGTSFVWKLQETGESGLYTASKAVVEVGRDAPNGVFVKKGLVAGERIATAGVSILTEGRKVTLLAK